MAMKMSKITACDVTDCSYNQKQQCHALAITVGGPEPCACCDTYLHAAAKGGVADMTGSVGACKVDSCSYNTSFECSASTIKVGLHQGHADCATFKAR
ncbi:hypothetical protein AOG1_31790 [Geobacter sp. AOG1]|nr:hypothetical protein AOG1_31790 [Geobacter sp. AOG1]